jgi:hypothetical protein
MIHWEIHPDKRHEVFGGFAAMALEDYQNQAQEKVNVIGRWHDVVNGTGVVICEADDTEALGQLMMHWNGVCDFEIVTALTDEEAHAVCREHFAAD